MAAADAGDHLPSNGNGATGIKRVAGRKGGSRPRWGSMSKQLGMGARMGDRWVLEGARFAWSTTSSSSGMDAICLLSRGAAQAPIVPFSSNMEQAEAAGQGGASTGVASPSPSSGSAAGYSDANGDDMRTRGGRLRWARWDVEEFAPLQPGTDAPEGWGRRVAVGGVGCRFARGKTRGGSFGTKYA